MGQVVIAALLLLNAALIVAMVAVLYTVFGQSKRIDKLAKDSQELAEHIEEHSPKYADHDAAHSAADGDSEEAGRT